MKRTLLSLVTALALALSTGTATAQNFAKPIPGPIPSPQSLDPATRAFHADVILQLPSNEFTVEGTIAVPSVKRLVIQYVSVFALLNETSERVSALRLTTTVGGRAAEYTILPLRVPEPGSITFVADREVRIYADGDFQVS